MPPENRTREHSGLSSPGKHTTHLTCFMISNLFKPVRSQPVSLKHLSQTESRAKCPAAAEGDEPWPLLPAGASRDLPRARGDRVPPGAPGALHSLSLPFSLFLSCCSFCCTKQGDNQGEAGSWETRLGAGWGQGDSGPAGKGVGPALLPPGHTHGVLMVLVAATALPSSPSTDTWAVPMLRPRAPARL